MLGIEPIKRGHTPRTGAASILAVSRGCDPDTRVLAYLTLAHLQGLRRLRPALSETALQNACAIDQSLLASDVQRLPRSPFRACYQCNDFIRRDIRREKQQSGWNVTGVPKRNRRHTNVMILV